MAQDKVLALLGFCKKAGKLIVGTENVTELLKAHGKCLVMLSNDISAKTEKELKYHASGGGAVFIRLAYDRTTVAHATATTAGVLATADEGFCKAILQGGND